MITSLLSKFGLSDVIRVPSVRGMFFCVVNEVALSVGIKGKAKLYIIKYWKL